MEKDVTLPLLTLMLVVFVVFYLVGHRNGYAEGCRDAIKFFGVESLTDSQCQSLHEMVTK